MLKLSFFVLASFFMLIIGQVGASYAPQTLAQQIESADMVVKVQITGGKLHQFTHEYHESGKPDKKHIKYESCGFTYVARVVESFKGESEPSSYIEFTSIEPFNISADLLLFLSESKPALATDVMVLSTDNDYNKKVAKCKGKLPKQYSMHLSTTDIVDYNWVGVSNFDTLPEDMYQSPFLMLKPENGEELKWNMGPSQERMYGVYARWQEFRDYLIETIQKTLTE